MSLKYLLQWFLPYLQTLPFGDYLKGDEQISILGNTWVFPGPGKDHGRVQPKNQPAAAHQINAKSTSIGDFFAALLNIRCHTGQYCATAQVHWWCFIFTLKKRHCPTWWRPTAAQVNHFIFLPPHRLIVVLFFMLCRHQHKVDCCSFCFLELHFAR